MIGRKLFIKRVTDDKKLAVPSYAHEGDAGIDLRVSRDVTIEPGAVENVGCGFAFAIPSGCVGYLFSRSSVATNKGVTLATGVSVIDSGYRGEISMPLVNETRETVKIEAGTRVCQLVIQPFTPCQISETNELNDTERGNGGFGSSGEK